MRACAPGGRVGGAGRVCVCVCVLMVIVRAVVILMVVSVSGDGDVMTVVLTVLRVWRRTGQGIDSVAGRALRRR